MGLGVLTKRPRGKVKTSLGGRGIDPQEVVRLLERAAVTQSKGERNYLVLCCLMPLLCLLLACLMQFGDIIFGLV
jgi:hypothetical protein